MSNCPEHVHNSRCVSDVYVRQIASAHASTKPEHIDASHGCCEHSFIKCYVFLSFLHAVCDDFYFFMSLVKALLETCLILQDFVKACQLVVQVTDSLADF